LIRDLIKPEQSDEPASALGSHVQEFAYSGDVPRLPHHLGGGPLANLLRATCADGGRRPPAKKEWTLTVAIRDDASPNVVGAAKPASESSRNDSQVTVQLQIPLQTIF
jgi:hypothetical protein